jgi:hypothetical protein
MSRYDRRQRPDPTEKRSRVFAVPRMNLAYSAAQPLRSLALGCHPQQAPEFNRWYQQHGISGAHHDASGDCLLESRQARNEVMKLRGLRDNDAGYGDWSGQH